MRYLVLLFTSLVVLFSSCSKTNKEKITQKPIVIVSVSPYDTFIKKITEGTVDVKTAVPANYNSHLFEPTPSQLAGFEKAKIWFGIGEPFEKNLLLTLKHHVKNLISIDLSQNLPLDHYILEETFNSTCAQHRHHHHDEELDRHFWTSPHLALIQVKAITAALSSAFPENKDLYEKNFLLLEKEFNEIDTKLTKLLSDVKNSAIIISHPSLGYFCKDYGIIQLSIECEGKTPLPGDLKKILSLSEKHPVLCVFTQEQFDNKGAIAVADYLKLPIYSINPNAPNYFENLNLLAEEIASNKK